ncbi:MAG: hypothetical protein PUP92_19345 [Rhizonema sp. PD38]|nr:hypothetical protein [Rhizonema sp. PD38]
MARQFRCHLDSPRSQGTEIHEILVAWNTPDEISIGGERNGRLNFWLIPNPGRLTFSDNQRSPHVQVHGYGNEFLDLPKGLLDYKCIIFYT